MFCLISWIDKVPCDRCLYNRLEAFAKGDSSPWGRARERNSRLHGAVAVVFFSHRVFQLVAVIPLVVRWVIRSGIVCCRKPAVAQPRSAVSSVNSCLADENPSILTYIEQAWECIAMSVKGFLREGSCDGVVFLIAWLGTFPAYHCIALRGKVCRNFASFPVVAEIELSKFIKNSYASCLSFLWKQVSEGNVIAADDELHMDLFTIRIDKGHGCCRCAMVHLACLGPVHCIVNDYLVILETFDFQFRPVECIGLETKTGCRHAQCLSVVYAVPCDAVSCTDIHSSQTIGI